MQRFPASFVGLVALGACAALAVASVRTFRAEHAYNKALDAIASGGNGSGFLRTAIRARPDWAAPRQLLAQEDSFDYPREGLRQAQAAVRLSPYDWKGWHWLSLIQYRLGDNAAAWSALQAGLRFNRGLDAHMETATLATVLGRPKAAWSELKQAIAVGPADWQVYTALDAAIRLSRDDADRLASALPVSQRAQMVNSVEYLIARHQIQAAALAWNRVETCPTYAAQSCGQAAADVTSALLQQAFTGGGGAPDPTADALRLWNHAVQQGWLAQGPASTAKSTDAGFRHDWTGEGFAWSAGNTVLHQVLGAAGAGNSAVFQFDGSEPETVELLHQWVAVQPGSRYRLSSSARRQEPGVQDGLRVDVVSSQGTLASLPLRLASDWQSSQADFVAGPHTHVVSLQLWYQRPNGQTLLRSPVWISNLSICQEATSHP